MKLTLGTALRNNGGTSSAIRKAAQMETVTYLTQKELAERWRVSPRTLERWRVKRTGPAFHKLGGKVSYSLDDIVAHERKRRAETHVSILGRWAS